jgi:hypothetical protein
MESANHNLDKDKLEKMYKELPSINKRLRETFRNILDEILLLRQNMSDMIDRLTLTITKKSGRELIDNFDR